MSIKRGHWPEREVMQGGCPPWTSLMRDARRGIAPSDTP